MWSLSQSPRECRWARLTRLPTRSRCASTRAECMGAVLWRCRFVINPGSRCSSMQTPPVCCRPEIGWLPYAERADPRRRRRERYELFAVLHICQRCRFARLSCELVLPPLHRRYCVSLGPWLVLAPSPRRRRSFNLDTVLRGGTRHVNAAPAGPAEEIWLNCLQGQNFVSDAFQQLCTCG